MCVVAVKIESKLVYMCSLYLDINLEVRNRSFLRLIDWCDRERIPLIVGTDSNAHSPLWGCPDKNERGEEMEDILLTQNLTLMNVGQVSTFFSHIGESIIDLTIANCYALENLNLEGWKVETEASFSDHRYISYSVGKYRPSEPKFRNLRKANWDLYGATLDEGELPEIDQGGSNLDDCAEALQKLIQSALNKACPLRKAVQRPPNPWWNPELDQIHKELGDLHEKCSRSQENWDAYVSLRRTYRNKIRAEKRNSWRAFCSEAEATKDIAKVVKILKPKPKPGICLFKDQG
ncbi:MAG: hypothetical protein AAFY57_19895, partial [Cyanobacteria bacterium J06642_2]